MGHILYVLKCEDNKYYVGKTVLTAQERFEKHRSGKGAIWTRQYKPLEIIFTKDDVDEYDEDKYVKIYMDKYGINNVRGGSYSGISLSRHAIKFLEKELKTANDLCFKCNDKRHFTRNCRNGIKYMESGKYHVLDTVCDWLIEHKIIRTWSLSILIKKFIDYVPDDNDVDDLRKDIYDMIVYPLIDDIYDYIGTLKILNETDDKQKVIRKNLHQRYTYSSVPITIGDIYNVIDYIKDTNINIILTNLRN